MTEKRKPTYDLASFVAWASSDAFQITRSALGGAAALGFAQSGIVRVIRGMKRQHFFKSMTSYADHTMWQDVYHVPSDRGLIYLKFQAGVITDFLLLSFKDKDNG